MINIKESVSPFPRSGLSFSTLVTVKYNTGGSSSFIARVYSPVHAESVYLPVFLRLSVGSLQSKLAFLLRVLAHIYPSSFSSFFPLAHPAQRRGIRTGFPGSRVYTLHFMHVYRSTTKTIHTERIARAFLHNSLSLFLAIFRSGDPTASGVCELFLNPCPVRALVSIDHIDTAHATAYNNNKK